MTRRDLVRLGVTLAAAKFAVLTPGRDLRAAGSIQDIGQGTIYIYAWEGGDGRREIAQGIFALNAERMKWTKVADQSERIGDRQSGIWVMDADGTNARRIFEATERAIPGGPAWCPDGQRIACSVHSERRHEKGYLEMFDHKLIILDLNGGAPATVAPPLASGLGDPQWAPSWKS